MPNMSYCRFENTLADIRDCLDAFTTGGGRGLSPSEARAASHLIDACREVVEQFPDGSVKPWDWVLLRRVLEEGPTLNLCTSLDRLSANRLEDAGYLTSTPERHTQVTITEAGIKALEADDED